MSSKKPTFSSLAKVQLYQTSYFILLFYFLIYFYYFIFIYLFFSQLPKYLHFPFSSSLSLCSRCIFSPSPPLPLPFFLFFPHHPRTPFPFFFLSFFTSPSQVVSQVTTPAFTPTIPPIITVGLGPTHLFPGRNPLNLQTRLRPPLHGQTQVPPLPVGFHVLLVFLFIL
jgi:hypothetical protein